MTERILIIGGGLSGLSAGCYARMSGFETHILEHAATTGGVCTAWSRAPYLVDGCIHWLTGAEPGGMFRRVYEELGVIRDVKLEPLRHFARFEDPGAGWALDLVQDLDDMQAKLQALGPDDTAAISQLFEAIREQRALQMPIDQPPELSSLADGMKRLWGMRKLAPLLIHFRGSVHDWADAHVTSAALRDVLKAVLIPEMPAIFLPFMLALIGTGQLSRPVGGSGAFS